MVGRSLGSEGGGGESLRSACECLTVYVDGDINPTIQDRRSDSSVPAALPTEPTHDPRNPPEEDDNPIPPVQIRSLVSA